MTDQPDTILLDRYIAGDCTAAERERVERWVAESADGVRTVAWMRELQHAARRLPEPWNPDRLWHGLERRLSVAESAAERPDARRRPAPTFAGVLPESRSAWSTHLLRIAAVLALVVGSIALWRMSADRGVVDAPIAMRTFATAAGERAEFGLVDGSRVMLGASSRLDVPDTYGRQSRDVYLHGQGYFEVVPNPEQPFRVHSGRAVTQVLGTKFGVRAYEGDSAIAVVVAEGRVAFGVSDSGGVAVLARGDLARLDARGGVDVERGVDVDRYLSWTQGRLEFVNAPLGDVLPELARWYDLEFRLADRDLAKRPLTASLGTESAVEMLRLLEASLNVRVERNGRVVVLHPKS